MKRLSALLLATVVVLGASTAYATWMPGAGGRGVSTSRSLDVPTETAASATSTSAVRLSWAAPAPPSVQPAQYVVRRIAPTTATVCTVDASTLSCDDTGLTAGTSYSYTVEARVGTSWSSGPSEAFGTDTHPQPTFTVATPASTQHAGSAFAVVITATTNGSTVDTAYSGPKALTYSGPGSAPDGSTPSYPSTVDFVSGIGTAWVTLVRAETVSLQVTDGTRLGADDVTVVADATNRLVYTTSTPACAGSVIVGNGGSFTSRVSVLDAYGNAVLVPAALPVSLSGAPGGIGTLAPTTLTIPPGASESSGSFTYQLPVGNPPDVTVTASSGSLATAQCTVRKNDH
jgi:hypothetical protein